MDDENIMDRLDESEDFGGESMADIFEQSQQKFKPVKRGEVVEGKVVAIDHEEVLIDIGLKSEAVLPLKELSSSGYGSLTELHVDDQILVYVLQPETQEGHAVVSVRKARQEHQWRVAQEMFERGEIIDAEVIEHNKGGLIVNLSGVRGFVPISQIMNLKREDSADNAETLAKLQGMVSKSLKLKIIEINRSRNRLILSERLAMQEWRTKRRDELLNELQVNEVRHGVVSNLAHFGAFVDLGGADGLVHISQLAWSRVNHPSEVLHIGQEVEVQVLSIDKERKKIALSIKRAEIDPWMTVEQRYTPGQIVVGTITKIAPFGAFARIENGIEGLIHVTEIYPPTSDAKSTLKEGQEVEVRILRIESDRRRLGLSMKAVLAPDASVPAEDGYQDAGAPQPEREYTASSPTPTPPRGMDLSAALEAPVTRQQHQPTPAPAPRKQAEPAEQPTTAFGAAFGAALRQQASQGSEVVPEANSAPSTPEAPATPKAASTPEAPATPSAPKAASTPEVAATPKAPEASTTPEAVATPITPEVASTPEVVATPAVPEASNGHSEPEASNGHSEPEASNGHSDHETSNGHSTAGEETSVLSEHSPVVSQEAEA